jgi:signal transduction histidine kinase
LAQEGAMPARQWPERRSLVLGTAALLFVATFMLREVVVTDTEAALGLFYVIPVALVGLELGLRAGVASAVATLVLVVVYRTPGSESLDVLGVMTRAVAVLSVGAIAGRFSDSMRSFQAHQSQLLAVEREKAALLAELHGMHRRLQDQFRNAGHILDVHERERRGIAEQLHEQAAQAMAAALLVVGRLERDIVDELTQVQLQRARHSVHECIAELRRLAATLHSPVLEELGLRPALERLLEREQAAGVREIDVRGLEDLPQLPADVEIWAYRVIEEALDALPGPLGVGVGVDTGGASLELLVEARSSHSREREERMSHRNEVAARLHTTRARLEVVGGSLNVSATPNGVLVAAAIPFGASVVASDVEYAQDSSQAA